MTKRQGSEPNSACGKRCVHTVGGAPPDDPAKGCISIATYREAIRAEQKIRITYQNSDDIRTDRIVRPVALIYHIECTMLAGWCELRNGLRHFRTDRIWACDLVDDHFCGQGEPLRAIWSEQNRWDASSGAA